MCRSYKIKGMALLETIILFIVLSSIAASISWAIAQLTNDQNKANYTSVATMIIQETFEDMVEKRRNPAFGITHITSTNYPDFASHSVHPDFSGDITITGPYTGCFGVASCKNINVTISRNGEALTSQSLLLME